MGYSQQRKKLESLFTTANIRHRSNSHMEMIEATRAGIGCSVLSCLVADTHEDLHQLYPGKIYHDRDIWLVTHSEIHKNARIRAIFDFLVDAPGRGRAQAYWIIHPGYKRFPVSLRTVISQSLCDMQSREGSAA